MGYSAEVVRRARARLAQEKEDRESENRQHLALAYEKVPRIREIDHELRVTMAKTAQAAFPAVTAGMRCLPCGSRTRGFSRSGKGWPGNTLKRGFWTMRPSAPSAAAAAMWVLPCANV